MSEWLRSISCIKTIALKDSIVISSHHHIALSLLLHLVDSLVQDSIDCRQIRIVLLLCSAKISYLTLVRRHVSTISWCCLIHVCRTCYLSHVQRAERNCSHILRRFNLRLSFNFVSLNVLLTIWCDFW